MQLKKFDSINVVPMIDIMLVLLVIVLTTATFIAKGVIPLELPTGKSAKNFPPKASIRISIAADGKIYVDGHPTDAEGIASFLQGKNPQSPVFLSGDKKARYERFVDVLDRLKNLGFGTINIVTLR
ncbi:biopolymer transporter ExbD [Nitratifractor sp.]|uniref:ExbD/TolR family protein n=1 Tax=Nitratifractor sp. TaxID=2268144 RepID=UPI0025E8F83F|nr:biopolymer transporter ExbD [Nitratifractor sp.]